MLTIIQPLGQGAKSVKPKNKLGKMTVIFIDIINAKILHELSKNYI